MSLTLMTYNIKNGGNGGRLAAVARIVAAQAPDILAMQELRGLPDIGGATGMRVHLARSRLGQSVAVLTARHVRVLDSGQLRRPLHHAVAWVEVATPSGPLLVLGAHLDPHWGTRRLLEARWLAGAVRKAERAVIMGDLNTVDPWTDHRAALRQVPKRYRRRHLRWTGAVDDRAVALLTRRGLVDLWRRCGESGEGRTVPTSHGSDGELPPVRLDYVFATPAVADRARACHAVRGGDTESASDHYPVVARLAL